MESGTPNNPESSRRVTATSNAVLLAAPRKNPKPETSSTKVMMY
jgi:hypothetical protein